MNKTKLILASGSPRRSELLTLCGYDFRVIVPDINEILDTSLALPQAIENLAYQKAEYIFRQFPDHIVIGADTIVTIDGLVLGKPKDSKHAYSMLKHLSGKTHQVITGVSILFPDTPESPKQKKNFHHCSSVRFYPLSDTEIEEYIQTNEPLDKAGSYGVQGKASLFIEKIEGDFYSIMGLPVSMVHRALIGYF